MKKIIFMILAFALILGTTMTAIPPAKAAGPVQFYVNPQIVAGKAPGALPTVLVPVFITSPLAWKDTADGIIGWTLSVRVNPLALEPYDVQTDLDLDADGLPDTFLDLYAMIAGYTILNAPQAKDTWSGSMWGFASAFTGAPTKGAGGDPTNGDNDMMLCRLRFKPRSQTIASAIDLMGPGQMIQRIQVSCRYTNAAGTTVEVPEVDLVDGGYVALTPDARYYDSMATYDPANPIGSDWHELWPTYSQEWDLTSWTNNGVNGLDASDQVDITQTVGSSVGTVMWGHVDWINQTGVADDGLTDMILFDKHVTPEFPLGIGMLMAIAPMIAIVYVWRLRKKKHGT